MSTFSIGKNANQGAIASWACCRHIAETPAQSRYDYLMVAFSSYFPKTHLAPAFTNSAQGSGRSDKQKPPGPEYVPYSCHVKGHGDVSIQYCTAVHSTISPFHGRGTTPPASMKSLNHCDRSEHTTASQDPDGALDANIRLAGVPAERLRTNPRRRWSGCNGGQKRHC